MSACYLYAIVQAKTTPQVALDTLGPGLNETPLQRIAQDGLAAVVSAWRPSRNEAAPAANEADIWRHEQVIEALMERGPTLPVRFGTIMADAARVQELLAARREAFGVDLAHVAGRVEIGLRVLWTPPASAQPPAQVDEMPLQSLSQPQGSQAEDSAASSAGPGTHYLQRLATQQRRLESVQAQGKAMATELNASLQPLAADTRMQVLQSECLLLSAAYLVESASVEAFRAQIEALRRTYLNLSFLVTGPWPAYHFVSDRSDRSNESLNQQERPSVTRSRPG